jgi:ubiquinone/menaquinone biosynthesis C-methylase UbiE
MSDADEVRRAFARQAVRWQDVMYRSWMPGNLFVHQEGERAWTELLRRNGFLPLDERSVLDVGCGSGKLLVRMSLLGARSENLAGVDLLENEVERARALAPHIDFRVGDATELPFDDASFDLVTAFTTFSSMRVDEMRKAAAAEIRRVLRPGGAVLWYDFWVNPRNSEVQALGMKDIEGLFPGAQIDAKRVTLAPPIARRVAGVSWLACSLLDAIPFLRTHWLALIRLPDSAGRR